MGMKYPTLFKDDIFIESLNIAKWQIYASCISDLSVFMAARVYAKTGDAKEAASVALESFRAVLMDRFANPEFTGTTVGLLADFEKRLALVDWSFCTEGEGAFKESPAALIRWAPIEDDLKKYDVEIVRNSIRFQWQHVRHDFIRIFDADAFLADLHRGDAKA